jgi:hypothetical protein
VQHKKAADAGEITLGDAKKEKKNLRKRREWKVRDGDEYRRKSGRAR